jgi:hypothetical protein
MEPCIGGSIDDYMGANVVLTGPVDIDTIFDVDVKFVYPGNSCGTGESTQGFSITVPSGSSASNFNACLNGAYFSGGANICDACILSCDNPAVSVTGFSC